MNKIDISDLIEQVKDILSTEKSSDSILLKISQLLKKEVYHYDWVGFYILNPTSNQLDLGPYAGKATEHKHIAIGKGVCGQVAANKSTMIVQDVSQIENYISCSIDVQSEIVVPILKEGIFVAEIDIDSHSPAPFTNLDKELLEEICSLLTVLF